MADVIREDGRRSVVLLLAAGVVVIGTVIGVLLVGVARPPALAVLAADARPDVSLAVFAYRDRGQCLDIVAPDGQVRQVRCGLDGVGPLIGWDETGIHVLRYDRGGEVLETLDPVTGEVLDRRRPDADELRTMVVRPGSNGWFSSERKDGSLVVRDADGRIVWTTEAPETYRVDVGATDPVSGRLALLDSARRLLLLDADADRPVVWVEDLGITYGELIWEGTGRVAE